MLGGGRAVSIPSAAMGMSVSHGRPRVLGPSVPARRPREDDCFKLLWLNYALAF